MRFYGEVLISNRFSSSKHVFPECRSYLSVILLVKQLS